MKNVKNGTDDRGDRDSSFGRLLAGALAARSASVEQAARSGSLEPHARSALLPGEECLDADTLAAWADDRLGREERRAAEAHAADCARCQALLAAMVKIAPVPAARKLLWRLPALGWLIPVTAAAAAIIIWVIVPGRAPLQRSDRPVSGAASAVDRFATADAPPPPAVPPAARLEEQTAQAEARPGAPVEPTRRNARPAAPLGLHGARADRQKATALEERAKNAAVAQRDSTDKKLSSSADANARSQTALIGGVAGAPEPKVEARSAAPSSVNEAVTVTTRASALAPATGTVIVSPNPASRWRIVPIGRGGPGSGGSAGGPGSPGSVIQRSTDGGSTWQAQDTGASATLFAGASPAPSVCWLVGPAGAVLLSTDGRSWQRLAFPDAVNLVSVTATDGKTATVTASDGRRFSTTDGGLTWASSGR